MGRHTRMKIGGGAKSCRSSIRQCSEPLQEVPGVAHSNLAMGPSEVTGDLAAITGVSAGKSSWFL